jgi:hypothetical protein
MLLLLNSTTRAQCGFASVGDVSTGMAHVHATPSACLQHTISSASSCRGDSQYNGSGPAYPEKQTTASVLEIGTTMLVGTKHFAVAAGRLDDTMESFFLSETLRYLYLLFTDVKGQMPDYMLFTTEGHIFHPGKLDCMETYAWLVASLLTLPWGGGTAACCCIKHVTQSCTSRCTAVTDQQAAAQMGSS